MSDQELHELIDHYLRDDLTESEKGTLTEWLDADEANQERFVSIIELNSSLVEVLSVHGETEKLIQLPRNFSPWWVAAAAALVVLIGGSWLRSVIDRSETLANAAHLVASLDARWIGSTPDSDMGLAMGHYQLESGSVDLLFIDGARVSLSGPTSFTLKSPRHIHLDSGNLVARIPDEALGFIVTSPQSEVVDLGTEFGVSVGTEGQTDVHVFDGLVEVLSPDRDDTAGGVMISEGQARRFQSKTEAPATEIPISSREALVSDKRYSELGVRMLRGSVRIIDHLSTDNPAEYPVEGNWIELIPEQQGVTLTAALKVTIDTPGSYRYFANTGNSLPPGTRLNSYLLHFRPGSKEQVRGVVRFDQPVVGVVCSGHHLMKSDPVFGIPSVHYPANQGPRGMEPGPHSAQHYNNTGNPAGWEPDEVILSQDRSTICINAYGNPGSGYDQVRVLTLAR